MGFAQDFSRLKGFSMVAEVVACVLVTFFLFRVLSLFGRTVWRILATLIVLCSVGASYYMTLLNVVIGYGIIASVMTTDIDLSKEIVGYQFVYVDGFGQCYSAGTYLGKQDTRYPA